MSNRRDWMDRVPAPMRDPTPAPSAAGHTPGPWHTTAGYVWGTQHGPGAPGGADVAVADCRTRGLSHHTYEANARLIAAAPALLAALDEMTRFAAAAMRTAAAHGCGIALIEEAQHDGVADGVGVRARSALAAARGERGRDA